MTAAETIESCQHKILEILEAAARNGIRMGYIENGGETAAKMARVYLQMGALYFAQRAIEKATACYEAALQLDSRQVVSSDGDVRGSYLQQIIEESARTSIAY